MAHDDRDNLLALIQSVTERDPSCPICGGGPLLAGDRLGMFLLDEDYQPRGPMAVFLELTCQRCKNVQLFRGSARHGPWGPPT
jgi:hypothetical protein